MKFIAAMNEAGISYESKELDMRNYHWILSKSGYFLSVQCSKFHYCYPRETLDLECYEDFEIAIIDKTGNFAYPPMLEDFNRNIELKERFEGSVFPYVPKDLVEDLYNFMNKG